MSRSSSFAISVLTLTVCCLAGCRSDPYGQMAISNLRAEKIQMENQYYELKAQYESDMARLGQPAPAHSPIQPLTDASGFIYGEILPQTTGSIGDRWQTGTISGPTPQPTSLDPQAQVSTFIRAIEISQLDHGSNEMARILVRPLDDQGAILPVPGDLKIRLYDPDTRQTIFEDEIARQTVATWVSDQEGQQPGIHVPLGSGRPISLSDRLVCDLQFRTADNRLLKQSIDLILTPNRSSNQATLSEPQGRPGQNVSMPVIPEGLEDAVNIEIGEELNFDSIESDSRPKWGPDR